MSYTVEWARATYLNPQILEEEFTDPYGQTVDPGLMGLLFDNGCSHMYVIEGTREELLDLASRIYLTIDGAEQ